MNRTNMRKPRRLPPPPPPPPRDQHYSPTLTFPRQAASEYGGAESIISGTPSTRSLQPINYPTTFGPLSSCGTSLSNFTSCCSCTPCQPVPQPKQRVSRPKSISISPEPQLINNDPVSRKKNRPYGEYQSLQYRRYLERQIERTFKYLRDRRERRKRIYGDAQPAAALLQLETIHLRSLRARITPEDFKEIKVLGCGAMGRVSLVQRQTLNQKPELYAMKRLKKSQVLELNQMAHVMAERDILAEADNEWIVQMHFSFQDNDFLYFILEYVPGGDLIDLLMQKNVFPEKWARFYIAEISLAVQAVHDMGFIHRDIKPDNILIDARGHVKLTDFGFCTGFRWSHDSSYYQDDSNPQNINNINTTVRAINNGGYSGGADNYTDDHPTITTALTKREIAHALKRRTLSCVGSPHYIAPEVLCPDYTRYDDYNERLCDWWSVGIILYEMIVGHCPFLDIEKLSKGQYDPQLEDKREVQKRILQWRIYLKFPNGTISDDAKDLINRFLCEPENRICQTGISEIQNHEFFTRQNFRADTWINIRSTDAPYEPELSSEYDTRHFESCLQSNDSILKYNDTDAKMPMHDFTFKRFFN